MSEEDLKLVLAKYQQKSFELYNSNIILEAQVERLNTLVSSLQSEIQKLSDSKSRKTLKADADTF